MGVDNAKVHDYIRNALDDHWSGTLIQRLDEAWQDVNSQRSHQCDNLSLAAADHYLIVRWLICKYSPAIAGVLSGMISAYDGAYKGARWVIEEFGGPDIVFRTGSCKATTFSPLVYAWAQTGISDGVLDCTGPVFQSSVKNIYVPKYPVGGFSRLFS